MITRICWGLMLLIALPAWPQADTTTITEAPAPTLSDSGMLLPPPVSDRTYPTEVGSRTRSNYLNLGLVVSAGYIDNVFAGTNDFTVSDWMYIISPVVSYDQTTPRSHRRFTYDPGFTFYQPTSSLNITNQNAAVDYQYDLSPHVALQLGDTFSKTSTAFNQYYTAMQQGISGSLQSATPGLVVPFAEQWTNTAHAEFSWQFALDSMIGGGGMATILRYPNPAQAIGVYNSRSQGGSAFYTHRFGSQYWGVNYQYTDLSATPTGMESQTQLHAFVPFVTFYVKPGLSLSLAAGPQHFDLAGDSYPETRSWRPSGMASISWHTLHTNFAASYTRSVTAGWGLVGAFDTDLVNAAAQWQMARTWTVGAGVSYATTANVAKIASATSGGNSVSGMGSLQHSMGQRLTAAFQYSRLHQSYSDIPAIASNPNSNLEMLSISWSLTRPLGR